MSIDSAASFTLRDDNGDTQTLWIGFSAIEGVQSILANGLAQSAKTRAEVVANIVEGVFDELPADAGLSFAQPPGVTHTIHNFDFDAETVTLTDPDTGKVKVTFPFPNFIERR